MKPSHFTIPRTLAECHFALNADPIEVPENRGFDRDDRIVMWGCAFAAVSLLVMVAVGALK